MAVVDVMDSTLTTSGRRGRLSLPTVVYNNNTELTYYTVTTESWELKELTLFSSYASSFRPFKSQITLSVGCACVRDNI